MNLLQFIPYLENESEMEEVILEHEPELDIELADIYLKKELSIYSEMFFFNSEEIEGKLEMEIEGNLLVNLFPLDYLIDVYSQYKNLGGTNQEIAQKIISFRIKDA
ncbi:hypothetical protein [Maribacter sp. 2-571]|uniref:hypothetical protein n=1 Tax=Maribacter sp. 2-571 TaxID=3417569 RepID=UPI003D34B237